MSLKIIGAGFGRTGTMSLKLALEQIGYGKCYHMSELLNNPEKVVHWRNAFNGEQTDWDELFSGYQAVVDFPGCLYVEELMAAYPEAKVVLSVRDPEKWWESASSTILNAEPPLSIKLRLGFRYPFVRRVRQVLRVVKYNVDDIYKRTFEGKQLDKETAIRVFNAHNERIKSLVPPDRLLVYEVRQGWAPLCEFLGIDIPEADFPRVNSREQFRELMSVVYDA